MATTALLAGIRYAAAALALGVLLLTGTGCSYDNPAETAKITPATNGINTVVGPIKLADMLILSYGADQPGRIMGTVFNTSSTDAVVTITGAPGSKVSIPVKANGSTSLAQPPAMVLEPTAGSPGSMVTVQVREDSTGTSADIQFPVLDSTLPEYQSYMPADARLPSNHTTREHSFSGHTWDQSIPQPQPLIPGPGPLIRVQTPGVSAELWMHHSTDTPGRGRAMNLSGFPEAVREWPRPHRSRPGSPPGTTPPWSVPGRGPRRTLRRWR